MPWDDSGDYIRSGHGPKSDTCRTIVISGDQGIKAIYCRYGDKWDIQSYLFDKAKWTMSKAKAWFTQHQQDSFEAERHPDFQRILDEFVKYYGSKEKGESEYYDWIDELGLDETKPYGYGLEAFRFAKDKISLWKEDEENKYYKVLIGFPLTSMNGNVYTEDELKAAAKTLIGITPNLNHWDDVKLTGCKFVDSAYEDGANEAILKVPKSLVCPECGKDKKFYEYIDEKHIVNVSLECSCFTKGEDGACRGMKYTGGALLTKDTLPGIPLARIFPLEAIMREALMRGHHKEKKKLVVKVVGLSNEAQLDPADPNKPLDKNPIKPDGHFQCPDGMIYSPTQGKCVPSKTCPDGQAWDDALGKCMPIVVAPPEGTDVQTGKQAAGDSSHEPIEYVKGVDYVEDRQGERDFTPSADWPDSCFAYVPPEAKGADGVKSARKLPYKWPDGEISWPNVKNALSRLGQPGTDVPDAEKSRLIKFFQNLMAKHDPDYEPTIDSKQDLENAELRLSNYRLVADKMTLEGKVAYYEAELAKNIDTFSTQKGELKALRDQVSKLEFQDRERADRAAKAEKSLNERSERLKADFESRSKRMEDDFKLREGKLETRIREHEERSKGIETKLDAEIKEHRERVQKFDEDSKKIDAERQNERNKHAEELAEARISARDALESRDAYKAGQEATKAELEKTNASYQKNMADNLELTKSLTAAHEETLNVTKERDDQTEKLKKAKRLGKVTVNL